MILDLSPGTPVYRFNRIRYADDAPMALEYSTVPGFALPSKDAVDSSLYDALDRHGCRPVRALQRLRAVLFNAEQAELLAVAPGAPGLLIERRGFLRDGRAVEFTQSYYRGDTYDFVAELNTSRLHEQDVPARERSSWTAPDHPRPEATWMFRRGGRGAGHGPRAQLRRQ